MCRTTEYKGTIFKSLRNRKGRSAQLGAITNFAFPWEDRIDWKGRYKHRAYSLAAIAIDECTVDVLGCSVLTPYT